LSSASRPTRLAGAPPIRPSATHARAAVLDLGTEGQDHATRCPSVCSRRPTPTCMAGAWTGRFSLSTESHSSHVLPRCPGAAGALVAGAPALGDALRDDAPSSAGGEPPAAGAQVVPSLAQDGVLRREIGHRAQAHQVPAATAPGLGVGLDGGTWIRGHLAVLVGPAVERREFRRHAGLRAGWSGSGRHRRGA